MSLTWGPGLGSTAIPFNIPPAVQLHVAEGDARCFRVGVHVQQRLSVRLALFRVVCVRLALFRVVCDRVVLVGARGYT